jgi:hypothetical protein
VREEERTLPLPQSIKRHQRTRISSSTSSNSIAQRGLNRGMELFGPGRVKFSLDVTVWPQHCAQPRPPLGAILFGIICLVLREAPLFGFQPGCLDDRPPFRIVGIALFGEPFGRPFLVRRHVETELGHFLLEGRIGQGGIHGGI